MILVIWLIGSILSYPRLVASFYEIDENYPTLKPYPVYWEITVSLIMSWLGVIAGICLYFIFENKYFWKWNKAKLHEQYKRYAD